MPFVRFEEDQLPIIALVQALEAGLRGKVVRCGPVAIIGDIAMGIRSDITRIGAGHQ